MQFRVVTGEERERLLGSRKPTGFDYGPYREAVNAVDDGDVVAVEIDGVSQRGEKIRFARAAGLANIWLRWLANPSQNEIAFTVTNEAPRRKRGRPFKVEE